MPWRALLVADVGTTADNRVTATVSRGTGAKITSLRAVGVEWLLQPSPDHRPGEGFVAAGLSGWDECLPTIDSCTLADGTRVPDHGAVWDQPWEHGADGVARVAVPSSGCEFQRQLRHEGSGLVLRYAVRNTSAGQVSVMWAAHPQLHAPEGTLVEAPVQRYVQTYPDIVGLPPASNLGIDGVAVGAARKVYVVRDERADFARIRRADGRWLQLTWDPTLIPHLGIWLDAGAFAHRPVIAIEPCIGWYDSLRRAIANRTSIELAPGEERQWWIRVTAGR